RVIALDEPLCLDDWRAHRRPKRATAPTMIRSAAPIMPTPAIPHIVEVVTVTRKFAVPFSPLAEAVSGLTESPGIAFAGGRIRARTRFCLVLGGRLQAFRSAEYFPAVSPLAD